MVVLITGGRGMVGTALQEVLKDHHLVVPEKYSFNVSNFDQVMKYRNNKIDFIVHLAAETDHEYCDVNPAQCYFVNTVGTAHMMRLAQHHNIPIIYLSAGSIFDGRLNRPYEWADVPNPINHYNASKWYGEMMVRGYEKHYVLRAGWMFGGGTAVDKKFVHKIMVKIARGDKAIKVCDDCIGSPTYTVDLAKVVKHLIEDGKNYGVYHAVNPNHGVSRYDFAKEIVKLSGHKVKIIRCKIDDLKDEFPCKRTNYEVLSSDFPHIMRTWQEALKEYIDAHY